MAHGRVLGTERDPRVVIVILNYCRWRETSDCIQSLRQCRYPNFEILIVDNASKDDSVEQLRKAFPAVEIVQATRNCGYTGGVNVGIRAALKNDPSFILLLNEDTIVTPNFLSELVGAMVDHPRAAAACGTIYHHPETARIWYAGGTLVPWRGLAVHSKSLPTHSEDGAAAARRVTFVTGCMTLIRVSALDIIGMKDERFFMSLEDIEHSARILKRGFDLLYVPRCVIYHRIPLRYESSFNLYYSVRNRLLLISEAFSPPVRYIARIYFLCGILVKMMGWLIIRPEFLRAARMGLQDYFANRLYEGRGVSEFAK